MSLHLFEPRRRAPRYLGKIALILLAIAALIAILPPMWGQ